MSHPQDATASSAACDIANVKLPDFWPADPALWFATIECLFRRNRITSQRSKFDCAVGALTGSDVSVVRDILLAPPAENPYDALKTALLRRTTESAQRRMQLLLTNDELTDEKPTQLLRRMLRLLGNDSASADSAIFRELFLQRLPHQVRMILSVSSADSLEALAEEADKIMEVGVRGIAAVDRGHAVAAATRSLDDRLERIIESNVNLARQVDKLTTELAEYRREAPGSLPQRRFNGRRHRASPSPPRLPSICWYHSRYGTRARQCRPPCSFVGNSRAMH